MQPGEENVKIKSYLGPEFQEDLEYESELEGVNSSDNKEKSMANANANSANNATTTYNGAALTASFSDNSDLSDTESGENEISSGLNLPMTNNNENSSLSAAMSAPLMESPQEENSDKEEISVGETNKQLQESEDVADNNPMGDPADSNPGSIDESTAALHEAISNADQLTHEESADGKASGNDAMSTMSGNNSAMSEPSNEESSGTAITNKAAEATSGDIMSLLGAKKEQTDEEKAKEEKAKSEKAAEELALKAAFNEGKRVGGDVGKSVGLGQIVQTAPTGKITMGQKFANREEGLKYAVDQRTAYSTAVNAAAAGGDAHALALASKKIEGYNVGFNEGYQTGVQMKLDLESAKLNANGDYQLGKQQGNTAGSAAGNGDMAKANELKAEAKNRSSEYQQGFYPAFSAAYQLTKNAAVQNNAAAEKALLNDQNSDYAQGYKKGEENARAVVSGKMTTEALNQAKAGHTEQYSMGYSQGVNKGYFAAKQVKVNAMNKAENGPGPTEAGYKHYLAGQIFGILAAKTSKAVALTALKDKSFDLKKLGAQMPTVPDQVYIYFASGSDYDKLNKVVPAKEGAPKADKSPDLKIFESAYYSWFNKSYMAAKTLKVQNEQRNEKNGEHNLGADIGRVAGEAAVARERLQSKLNAGNLSAGEINAIQENIDNITANLDNIKNNLSKANSDYKAGYYQAFSSTYQQEKSSHLASQESYNENMAEKGSASDSDYGFGHETGKAFGEQIYERMKSAANEDEKQSIFALVRQAKEKASAKGESYFSGFTAAYNMAATTGKQEDAPKLDEKSQIAQDALKAALSAELNPLRKKYLLEGKKYGFDLYFKFYKDGGKNPEAEINKKLSKFSEDLLRSNNQKDPKDKEKIPNLDRPLADKLKSSFEEGVNIHGKKLGNAAGEQFKKGRNDALSGKTEQLQDRYYLQGFETGQNDSAYRDFRDAVMRNEGLENELSDNAKMMDGMGEIDEEGETKQKMISAYRDAYNSHHNSWLKVFTILRGAIPSEDYKEASLDFVEDLELKGSDVQKANTLFNTQEQVIEKVVSKEEQVLRGQNESNNTLAMKLSDQFRKGYEKSVDDAMDKVQDNIGEELIYQKGLAYGVKSSGALETADSSDETARDLIELSEEPEDESLMEIAAFREGRMRGVQIGMLINAGNAGFDTYAVELRGPQYAEGYRMGTENGETAADEAEESIAKAEALPRPEEDEDKANLEGDALMGYNDGYNEAYLGRFDYLKGYYKAHSANINNTPLDDYDDELSGTINYRSEYYRGIREGRDQGMLDMASGNTDGTAQKAFQQRNSLLEQLNNMNESDAFAEGATDGYDEGYAFASNNKTQDNEPLVFSKFSTESFSLATERIKTRTGKLITENAATQNGKLKQQLLTIQSTKDEAFKNCDNKQSFKDNFKTVIKGFKSLFQANKTSLNEDDLIGFNAMLQYIETYLGEYSDGFDFAAPKGIKSGLEIATEKKATSAQAEQDLGQNFFKQMMNSIGNDGNEAYGEGFGEANKMAYHLVKTNPTESFEDLKVNEIFAVNKIFAAFKKNLTKEYKQYRNENKPPATESTALADFHETTAFYRQLISEIDVNVESNHHLGEDIKAYIEGKTNKLLSVFDKAISEIPDSGIREYFTKLKQENWVKFIESFSIGFHSGFDSALRKAIHKRDGIGGEIASGINDENIQKMHDLLMGGVNEDLPLDELEWLDAQNEIVDYTFRIRSQVETELQENETADDSMAELISELNWNRENREMDKADNTEDDELMDEIDSLLTGNPDKDLENRIKEQETIIRASDKKIDSLTGDYLDQLSTVLHFEAPKDSFSKFRDYLKDNESQLKTKGNFDDKDGYASIMGKGSLEMDDFNERIIYEAEILLGLGDLSFSAEGFENDIAEQFITLNTGVLTVPKIEAGESTALRFNYDRLDLEIGLGLIEQVEQQLKIDDRLSAGQQLMSSVLKFLNF